MTINFETYRYYPALRTRPAEVKGYSELTSPEKQQIIPIFTAGIWPRQTSLETSIEKTIEAAAGNPIILDLTDDPNYSCEQIRELRNSDNNFQAWQDFIKKISAEVIPVIQITKQTKMSQVIRQAREFENSSIKIAFKIKNFGKDTPEIIAALSALDSTENALTIIDAGYTRETLSASLAGCITAINEIREEVPESIITTLSTSFPSSVTQFLDPNSKGQRGLIPMFETKLHAAIGSDAAIYGDHGSIHSGVYTARGGRYTPRIDYPLNDVWVFERRPENNSSGYIDAARVILEAYPEIQEDDSWGALMIRRAASGEIDGMKTPSSWIAARVNMHISKQILLTSDILLSDEEDFDDLI